MWNAHMDISIGEIRGKPVRRWRTLILYYGKYECHIHLNTVYGTSGISLWVRILVLSLGTGLRALIWRVRLFQIVSLRRGAYLKLDTNSSIYGYLRKLLDCYQTRKCSNLLLLLCIGKFLVNLNVLKVLLQSSFFYYWVEISKNAKESSKCERLPKKVTE